MPLVADNARQLAAALIVFSVIVAALVLGRAVLMPLALAVIASFMLAPIVRWVAARGVPDGLSVGGVLTMAIAAFLAIALVFSTQLLSVTASLEDYKANIVDKARSIAAVSRDDGLIKRAADVVDRLGNEIGREIQKGQVSKQSGAIVVRTEESDLAVAGRNIAGLMQPLAEAGLTVLLTLFLLLQHQDLRDRVVRVLGTDHMSETTGALSEAGSRLSRLFLSQAILNGGYGVVVGVVLGAAGLPGALLWGVLAALMRFVPFVGSFVAAVPPILLAAGVDPGWNLALFTALFFLVSEVVIGQLIEPQVLGRSVGLSPFAIIAATSFWTIVWGPIGLLVAAPLTVSLVVIGRFLPGLSFLDVLLGDEPALSPQQQLYHRLLSGDALAVAEQIETAKSESSLAQVVDRIVLPALGLAAADDRAGRLTKERTDAIRETLAEAVQLGIVEEADPKAAASASADVLVVAARGDPDRAAAQLIAAVIARTTGVAAGASDLATGLTALAGARQNGKSTLTDIVLVTVGGTTRRQLELMTERARRDFPASRVTALALERALPADNATGASGYVTSVAELLAGLAARAGSKKAADASSQARSPEPVGP